MKKFTDLQESQYECIITWSPPYYMHFHFLIFRTNNPPVALTNDMYRHYRHLQCVPETLYIFSPFTDKHFFLDNFLLTVKIQYGSRENILFIFVFRSDN